MSFTGLDITVHKYKSILSNPVKVRNLLKTNKKDMGLWSLLVAGITTIYLTLSDGEFSFLLTVASLVQMFGFFLIALKVRATQSASGLSLNTQICYAVSFFAKLVSIIRHEGYLPFDSTGDVVYRVSEFLSLLLSSYVIYMTIRRFKYTYDRDLDRVHWSILVFPALVLGALIHPGLNSSYVSDIAWAVSLYTEAVGMFPQLYMFFKKGGEVESFTSHFVASQGIGRILYLIFWVFSYHELNDHPGKIWSLFKGNAGYFVMGFQALQLILFSDFLYEYIKSLKKGLPMTIGGGYLV